MAKKPPTYPVIENPSTRMFWKDLGEEKTLLMCSMAARGLWAAHMLPIMAAAGGYLAFEGRPLTARQLAGLVSAPVQDVEKWLAELGDNFVYSFDRHNTPYNRRMVRSQKRSQINAKNGQKGGRPKSLISLDNSDHETESESKPKANGNRKAPSRAQPLQDSYETKKDLTLTGEKIPATANGHGRAKNGNLNGGQLIKRVLHAAEWPDTQENRRKALLLQMALPQAEAEELAVYTTPIARVSQLITKGLIAMDN